MIKRNLLVLGLAALLSACGFQLRGTGTADFALREIDLQARNSYGDTVKQLERVLEGNGVDIHPGARFRLELTQETSRQRAASHTSSARTAESELTLAQDYAFLSRDGLVLLEDSVEVQRVFVYDSSNLIGSSQTAKQLEEEMRRELVDQLAMRLQRITASRLEQLQQAAEARARAEARALEAARRQQAQPQQSPIQIPSR